MFVLLNAGFVSAQSSTHYPEPIGFVNDFEHDFTPAQVKSMENTIRGLLVKAMDRDSIKGLEIAVVTVTDSMFVGEKEMSDYATKIGDKWGVGTKYPNQGIIIAYGRNVRKVAIVTGTGLDKILPPQVCNDIISQRMAAEFKTGHPYNAILAAIYSIADQLGVSLK